MTGNRLIHEKNNSIIIRFLYIFFCFDVSRFFRSLLISLVFRLFGAIIGTYPISDKYFWLLMLSYCASNNIFCLYLLILEFLLVLRLIGTLFIVSSTLILSDCLAEIIQVPRGTPN